MRAQSVADEVPATVLSLYVSKAKLSRWMFAGGLVGMILVDHQPLICGYRLRSLVRASAVVNRQTTRL